MSCGSDAALSTARDVAKCRSSTPTTRRTLLTTVRGGVVVLYLLDDGQFTLVLFRKTCWGTYAAHHSHCPCPCFMMVGEQNVTACAACWALLHLERAASPAGMPNHHLWFVEMNARGRPTKKGTRTCVWGCAWWCGNNVSRRAGGWPQASRCHNFAASALR